MSSLSNHPVARILSSICTSYSNIATSNMFLPISTSPNHTRQQSTPRRIFSRVAIIETLLSQVILCRPGQKITRSLAISFNRELESYIVGSCVVDFPMHVTTKRFSSIDCKWFAEEETGLLPMCAWSYSRRGLISVEAKQFAPSHHLQNGPVSSLRAMPSAGGEGNIAGFKPFSKPDQGSMAL